MANKDMLIRVNADTKNYNANLSKASKTLDQFAKTNLTASGVIKQATTALTGMAAQCLSVAAAIGAAKKVMSDMIRINKQFEQGTAVLASIIGKTTDEISALTNQAKQLGATTRYTAMQITELQTNLARLGFTEQEILNSTKAIQAFATATGADLGEAANLAGAALRGFGMNATEMERAASVMAVSTTKSALSFEKLATAIPIVAPVAKQFGFTIEDTVTLLAKLSDAGMDASTAATATRNVFLKMANDSGKLSQALGRPVHSVEEFGEALKEMKEKGMSLNDILQMVGVRSTAAFAVFADNADTLKDFKQSITDCGDAMGEMENKQLNTLQGSITILNSAWEGLMLTFSESNGVIKTVVDSLSDLLQAYTRWRNRNQGGDAAIQSYELGVSNSQKQQADQIVAGYRAGGSTDKQIAENINKTKQKLQEEEAELRKVYDLWEKRYNLIKSGKSGLASSDEFALLREKGLSNTTDVRDSLAMQIAGLRDQQAVQDYMLGLVTPAPSATSATGKGGGDNGKGQVAKLRAQYEAEEKEQIAHLDRMNMSEADYEANVYEIRKSTLEQILKLYDEDSKEYAQVKAKMAQEDIRYQGVQMRLAKQTEKDEKKNLTNLQKRQEKIDELTASIKEMQTILESDADANTKAWATTQLKEYQTELDKLNGKLTEVSTNAKTQFDLVRESLDKFGSGIGAVSTLGNALDNLKNIGEDLASAFSGEMDAWDALMTVFNSGIGILETIVGVMDAINTLQELSVALSKKKEAEQAIETTTVVAGKQAESQANITEAGTSMISAGADTSEAAAKAGKSVAWIPIVGPILAVAAIAAVLGATLAAMSKAKSASHFATGGIVPGNDYSDNTPVFVSSGELILNRAQQNNIAGQLQGGNQGGQITGTVTGANIYLALANFAKQNNKLAGTTGGLVLKIE